MSRWDRIWYRDSPLSAALLPLSWLYRGALRARRAAWRRGLLTTHRVGPPVIVVGNVVVGGVGKTPLVLWLVEFLRQRGRRPGVVARGYRGSGAHRPRLASVDDDPAEIGDEPLLIARRCGSPVAVGVDRPAAARLLAERGCDVIVSDDGLQHAALARDMEIVVVDGVRGMGNGRLLPAGPLREPVERLRTVDFVLRNGGAAERAAPLAAAEDAPHFAMTLRPQPRLRDLAGALREPLATLAGTTVHAVAGIGNPERFFALLRALGLRVIAHPFPDHHPFVPEELRFGDDLPTLLTEKDGVKLHSADLPHCRVVTVDALPDAPFVAALGARLEAMGL